MRVGAYTACRTAALERRTTGGKPQDKSGKELGAGTQVSSRLDLELRVGSRRAVGGQWAPPQVSPKEVTPVENIRLL